MESSEHFQQSVKCRTCMAESRDQISIFESQEINQEYLRLADMLNIFTNLEFKSGDKLPNKICQQCVIDIGQAFIFRQKCISTDSVLRKEYVGFINSNVTKAELIKVEPPIDELLLLNHDFDYTTNKIDDNDDIENIDHNEIISSSTDDEYDDKYMDDNEEDDDDDIDRVSSPISKTKSEIIENEISGNNSDTNKPDEEIRRMNNRLLIHKCPTCKKGFDREDKMKRHAKIHDVPENKYYCEYCCKGYKMLQTYKSHMKSHDPNNTNKCPYCNSIFSTIYELERHIRIHTGEKPFKCDECDKGFAQRNGLVRHLVNFHKKDIGYSQGYGKTPHKKKPCLCEVCGAEKKNAFALKIHMRQHTGEKPHRCDICGKGFVVPFQLKMHMRSHTGEKPHQCDLCCKSFSQRIGLEVHRRTHTGEKPCICEICEKAFTVPSHLKMHMRSHTGEKPYKCEVCFKGFTQNTILQNHMKSHTGNTFNCVFCSKGFNQKHNLKRHMKIHTGEKPFECNICNRRFSEKLSMKYHVQTHSGEKPYSKLAARLKARKVQDQDSFLVHPSVLVVSQPNLQQNHANESIVDQNIASQNLINHNIAIQNQNVNQAIVINQNLV